jgi:nitrite reductase/ring-hydroxylating ferredoxin subunit
MVLVPVARVSEIPPGTVRQIVARGAVIALANVAGTLFATDGVCLHRGGPLGEGELDGRVLTCPLHGWTYDVTTGQSHVNPAARLRTYRVVVEGDEVRLDL